MSKMYFNNFCLDCEIINFVEVIPQFNKIHSSYIPSYPQPITITIKLSYNNYNYQSIMSLIRLCKRENVEILNKHRAIYTYGTYIRNMAEDIQTNDLIVELECDYYNIIENCDNDEELKRINREKKLKRVLTEKSTD